MNFRDKYKALIAFQNHQTFTRENDNKHTGGKQSLRRKTTKAAGAVRRIYRSSNQSPEQTARHRSSEHSPETPAFATVHAVSSFFG
ncbi:hypothetical protein HanPI659440_Chr12g0467621 [Helianthus annuus]|nr:hypothetical protein HanPI659440_Chr12g0467621 [Helianthus annuus]